MTVSRRFLLLWAFIKGQFRNSAHPLGMRRQETLTLILSGFHYIIYTWLKRNSLYIALKKIYFRASL